MYHVAILVSLLLYINLLVPFFILYFQPVYRERYLCPFSYFVAISLPMIYLVKGPVNRLHRQHFTVSKNIIWWRHIFAKEGRNSDPEIYIWNKVSQCISLHHKELIISLQGCQFTDSSWWIHRWIPLQRPVKLTWNFLGTSPNKPLIKQSNFRWLNAEWRLSDVTVRSIDVNDVIIPVPCVRVTSHWIVVTSPCQVKKNVLAENGEMNKRLLFWGIYMLIT